MIEPPMTLRLEQGQTRAHPYVSDILMFHALALEAISVRAGIPAGLPQGNAILACMAGGMDLRAPLQGFIEAAMSGEFPSSIDIEARPKIPNPNVPSAHGLTQLNKHTFCAIFALFAEAVCDWVKLNHTSDIHKFPPTINFGRVVRNAIVHSGTINLTSPNSPVVSWRGLTYSFKDKGRDIVHRDLSTGDLVLIMLEMEIELNGLGAPFDLG